jgi:hypothetical protein
MPALRTRGRGYGRRNYRRRREEARITGEGGGVRRKEGGAGGIGEAGKGGGESRAQTLVRAMGGGWLDG